MKQQSQHPLGDATAEKQIARIREGDLTSTRKKATMKTGSIRLFGSVLLVSLPSLLCAPPSSQAGGTVVGWGGTTVPAGLTNVVAIAAGYSHSLALKADGTVAAWGQYLVPADPAATNAPATVPPELANVVAVAGGVAHSLALRADGTVVAWGINTAGQTDVPVGLTNAVAISAGSWHSLALKADGTVVGWGASGSSVPAGLTNVSAIGAGSGSLALKADGSIVVWGPWWNNNTNVPADLTNVAAVAGAYFGWLALKTDGAVVDSFSAVPAGLTNVVAISGSSGMDGHVNLALKADGTVVGWGFNFGEPRVPAGLSNVVAIAAGGYHRLALIGGGRPFLLNRLLNRTAVIGGETYFRIEATGTRPLSYQWQFNGVNLPGATNAVLALTDLQQGQGGNYTVKVTNAFGAVSSANALLTVAPVVITTQPQDQLTFAGGMTTFGVVAQGSLPLSYQWRINGVDIGGATNAALTLTDVQMSQVGAYSVTVTSRLGGATSRNALLTVQPSVIIPQQQTGITFIGGPAIFSVIALTSAQVVTFQWEIDGASIEGAVSPVLSLTNVRPAQAGHYAVTVSNEFGLVRSSPASLSVVPVAAWGALSQTNVPVDLTNVLAIAGGIAHGLALRSDATVTAWGSDSEGETKAPPGLTNVVALAGGTSFSIALKVDGTVAAWGRDYYGQTDVPAGLTDVVAIAAHYFHGLALKADGTVVRWGYHAFGDTNVPAGLTNIVAIAAGGYHNLALRSDGRIVAWGDDSRGQLDMPADLTNAVAIASGDWHNLALTADGNVVAWGLNSDGESKVPIGLANVVGIACGSFHSLALKANGSVVTWGFNMYGQTNVPGGLTNVAAIAGGAYFSLALVGDGPPVLQVPLINPALGTNNFTLSVPTQSGRVYRLEYKNSLAESNWTALPLVAGNGGVRTLSDPTAAGAQRFYRVRRW